MNPYLPYRQKDGRIALILSVFLGFFGIDRFYLGKPIGGLLKLSTGALGGIWYIYDILMIATDNMADGNGIQLKW